MRPIPPELAGHPDRIRWNARYSESVPSFTPHPVAQAALALPLPDGPVLELACGPSGSALLAAATGRSVTVVDASDVALGMLADEAERRGLGSQITPVLADLGSWQPPQPDSRSCSAPITGIAASSRAPCPRFVPGACSPGRR